MTGVCIRAAERRCLPERPLPFYNVAIMSLSIDRLETL